MNETVLSRRDLLKVSAGVALAAVESTILPSLMGADDSAKQNVIDVGSRRELFVDGYVIERMTGAARRLHHPAQREIVLVCDKPWEGNFSGEFAVFEDEGKFRMYYRGSKWSWNPADTFVCYAESEDGIRWTRPELGLVEFNGTKKNNIVLKGMAGLTFAPFRDTNPDCPPEQRYKSLVLLSKPKRGLYSYRSADGLRWSLMSDQPVITKGYFDSQNVSFWDPTRHCYLSYVRGFRKVKPGTPNADPASPGFRDVLTCASPDFLNWTEPEWLQYPGAPDEQLYYNQIQPYYRAPHILIGTPGRFMATREIAKGVSLVTQHPAFSYAGVSDVVFMSSRDGRSFHRWPEGFIRPGPRKERWIYPHTFPAYGMLVTPPDNPDAPDELSLYVYEDGYWLTGGKATRLRRYTLRIDGFVSVQAPLSGGEFVTKPLKFDGNKLKLNFSTSAAGSIRVEIQDAGGIPIEGFKLEDCPEIFGDNLARVVHWKNGNDVSQLAGKPVRLRFVLKDADLYALQFVN